MSENVTRQKKKYVRKTAKNSEVEIFKKLYPFLYKKIKNKNMDDDEIRKYFEEIGFKNGKIEEPDELPLVYNMTPSVQPTKRCPIGQYRDKDGNCVPKKIKHTETDPYQNADMNNQTKRCPKGQHRDKEGNCVPKKIKLSDVYVDSPEDPEHIKDPEPIKELVPDQEPVPNQKPEPIPNQEPTTNPTKRCPKGKHRNKEGNCVPKKTKRNEQEPTQNKRTTKKNRPNDTFYQQNSPVVSPENTNNANIPHSPTEPPPPAKKSFLDEKERLKQSSILENHDYLYPDLDDPNFNIKLALKKEFGDSKYDGKTKDIEKQANLLCNAKFELSPHQIFVKNFLSSDTPYKGLLLYHGLGTGKTCSAIGVAEEMRQYMKRTGLKRQIFVVASPNLQGNFRQQLFDERKLTKVTNAANPNEFTWNIDSCVGNSLLQEINPNSIRNLTREKIISNINSLINENYAFLGYIQFANVARAHMLLQSDNNNAVDENSKNMQEENNIRQFFDERLIIIDEIHNIRLADDNNRKEMQQVAAVLMKIVQHARGLRLLLLSATPMFNSYKEIIWITNLLNANDGRSQIKVSDVFENNGSFKPGGDDILRRKLTGYVSYVRGENPYTFPYRLYPSIFSPEKSLRSFVYPRIQMNGVEIDSPIQNINIYVNRVEKTTYQMQVYLSIIDYMRRKSHGFYTNVGLYREMPSFENMDSFGYTLLQRPLEALNIVYPDKDILQMLSNKDKAQQYTDEIFQNSVGGAGLAKIMSFSAVENNEPLKHEYEYKPNILKKFGRIFSPEELPKYSSKIAEICREVKNSEGIVLIYSQYIDGGVVPIALALEEMGFSRYNHSYAREHKHLFKKAPTAPIDAITMQPRESTGEFRPAQYIMITGDKGLSPSNTEDVKYATNKDNMDGSKVKVIIISKAGSEGLDFKAIRQIHILEPWFNMNRIEQIIGRGVRNLSHCGIKQFKKRNTQIYLHSTLIEGVEEESADLYLYRLAEKKAMQIGKVSRLIKESAADCILNIGQTNFTAEKLYQLAANQNIRLELSSRDIVSNELREVDFRIGDVSGSELCDYMSCEYQCNPDVSLQVKNGEEKGNAHSYTERNLESNIHYIIGRIKELFRERHIYTHSQICSAINIVSTYPVEQIYYVLSKFVNNKNMVLFDKYGRFGYLVNSGNYYEFQPVEITDERASIRDRSVPVEYKRSNIILELPDKITEKKKPGANINGPNPVDEWEPNMVLYGDTIKEIRELLTIVKTPQNIKSTEMNWYKNASRALEHLHIVYGFDERMITKYTIYHYLDSSDYVSKRNLFQHIVDNRVYDIDPEIERYIDSYFRNSIMQSKSGDREGIYIANREMIQLVVRDEDDILWTEGDKFDAEDFAEINAKYSIDTEKLNAIVGYMIQFKDQDMSFYYKDVHLKRNKKGRKCDRSGGKAPIIDMLNRVIGTNMYSEEKTSSLMYSGSLCVMLEMLLRKYNEERKSGKIYYLTPEQAIFNKITDYSSAAI